MAHHGPDGERSPGAARLERADRTLLKLVDGAFTRAARRAGEHLACHPGCSRCCLAPFPVTALDARRLRRGLDELAQRDPARARAVAARARRAVELLRPDFPGDPSTGALAPETGSQDCFFAAHAGLPCPALDPVEGTCLLYQARPVSCRTYGPPARFGTERTEPCSLCFTGADARTVETCRMAPDPGDYEGRVLAMMEGPGAGRETLIAFALAGAFPGEAA